MITVFIAISDSLVEMGLTSALIRKQNCTDEDYNTMFFTNLAMGLLMFTIIYLASGFISSFYKMPDLNLLIKIMAVNLIVNSFGLIETAILTKNIDFKLQTKISLISSTSSGVVGITLAFMGLGYWSLAIKTITQNVLRVLLLHIWSSWHPRFQFSKNSLKELFGFGLKILTANLIGAVYKNIYKLIIGKYFSAQELGFFTRADQFKNLPSRNLEMTTQQVTYPVLASIASDDVKLKAGYKKLIKLSFYITCTLMLLMMSTSKEIIQLLVGDKWIPAIPYLRIMCISATLYPLHSLNLNMLNARNRPDLYLKLEIIKKILVIPIIVVGIKFGMIVMLWGMVFNSFIAYLLNSMWSAKLVNYPTSEQLLDIMPTAILSIPMVIVVWLAGLLAPHSIVISFVLKITTAFAFIILTGQVLKRIEYLELKAIIREQIVHHRHILQKKLIQ